MHILPYVSDVYFDKLTDKQKEMWICTISYSIMGISIEYAEKLTDEMIFDEIELFLKLVR